MSKASPPIVSMGSTSGSFKNGSKPMSGKMKHTMSPAVISTPMMKNMEISRSNNNSKTGMMRKGSHGNYKPATTSSKLPQLPRPPRNPTSKNNSNAVKI